jgi:pimeloyl-ACP methyl ester carboxylesterase
VDDGRIWDIAATARYLMEYYEGEIPLHLVGEGAGAVLGAYAMLLEPDISGAILDSPFTSHMDDSCPPLLNVLRVCDVPDILGALAPRSLTISGWDTNKGEKVARIYKAANELKQLIIKSSK